MADNNGIATDPDFRCGAKGRHGWRPRAPAGRRRPSAYALPARARRGAETHCGRSTALIASAPALDAGAWAGKLMRRSENSSSKARPTPVVRPRTWPPRPRSALIKWKCQPGTLTEVVAAG